MDWKSIAQGTGLQIPTNRSLFKRSQHQSFTGIFYGKKYARPAAAHHPEFKD